MLGALLHNDGNDSYLRAAGAAGQGLLLRALGGDGGNTED